MQHTNECHLEFKFLFMIFKIFLKQRKFHNTFIGGVGSFLLHGMILAFLRDFKQKFLNNNEFERLNEITLSEYLIKFLSFYVNFD